MKNTLTAIALSIAALTTQAQQTTTITGDDGRSEQQNIGDTDASNNHTNSTSTQLGNSANANGATITTGVDTDVRNQNTVDSAGGAATGGAAIGNQADTRSSVGNTSASSGGNNLADTNNNQTNATTGASSSGGNKLVGQNTSTNANLGGNTSGQNTGTNTSANNSAGGSASAVGGTSRQGQSQGIQESGNSSTRSAVNVDSSNRSTANYKVIAPQWAPIFPGPAAPPVAAGNLLQDIGACGPRGIIISHKVTGIQRTAFGGREHIDQGYDQELVDDPVPYIYINGVPHGHIVTTWTVTIAVSNAASLSLGGFKDGAGVQGGGSSSAALVRLVQRFTTRTCVLAVKEPQTLLQQTLVPAPRQDRN